MARGREALVKSSEMVMEILSANGRSKRSLAIELGISAQALESRLSTSPRVETLANTLGPLGYEVFAVPSGTRVEGGYRLDG